MENNKKTVILLRILPIIGVILSILTAIFLRANYDTTLHFKYFLLNLLWFIVPFIALLKQDDDKITKALGVISIIIMLISSFILVYLLPSYNIIHRFEKILNYTFPEEKAVSIWYNSSYKDGEKDFTLLLAYDEETGIKLENDIKQSPLWTDSITSIEGGENLNMNKSFDYILIFDEITKEYNKMPSNPEDYSMCFVGYNVEARTLVILEQKKGQE